MWLQLAPSEIGRDNFDLRSHGLEDEKLPSTETEDYYMIIVS